MAVAGRLPDEKRLDQLVLLKSCRFSMDGTHPTVERITASLRNHGVNAGDVLASARRLHSAGRGILESRENSDQSDPANIAFFPMSDVMDRIIGALLRELKLDWGSQGRARIIRFIEDL